MGGARSETWVTLFLFGKVGLERRPIMPWNEVTTVTLRAEFVRLALNEDANISQLCERFQISRKTGYKWLARFRSHGDSGLSDQSRRPTFSPGRTPSDTEAEVLRLRDQHPAWGGRKLRARLITLKRKNVPTPSTITAILRRHERIGPDSAAPHAFVRFQRDRPNELWQMDFKGHFPTATGRCHPLTVLDVSGGQGVSHYGGQGEPPLRGGCARVPRSKCPQPPVKGTWSEPQVDDQGGSVLPAIMAHFLSAIDT